jgi:hypothetical protein
VFRQYAQWEATLGKHIEAAMVTIRGVLNAALVCMSKWEATPKLTEALHALTAADRFNSANPPSVVPMALPSGRRFLA